MGRIAAHTPEQVFEAADKLALEGFEVTPNALRDVLGGRGSYSTLVRHIETWQQARKSAPLPVVLEMPDSVKGAFAQCWHAAASEAGKEIASVREKADAEVKVVRRRLEEAVAAIEQLETEANADAARLEASVAALAASEAAARQAATDAAAREAGLSATVEQMRQQIEAQQAELARVHGEAEAVGAQQAAEMERLGAEHARQLGEQGAALEGSLATAERLRAQLADAAQKLETATERERQANQELRSQAQALGAATGELDALRVQVAEQTEIIKRFAEQPQGRAGKATPQPKLV